MLDVASFSACAFISLHASCLKQFQPFTFVIIVIFKNNKVLKITITTRGGESKQTHSHRRDATQSRIIFDDGYKAHDFMFTVPQNIDNYYID